MYILTRSLILVTTLTTMLAASAQDEEAAVAAVLDAFHGAAAQGDWTRYFALMSEDGVFLGTDAGERWPKAEFEAYARQRSGWLYQSETRHINFTPDGNTAWFDEILRSASYGTSRGTGVLIRTPAGWRISQYHLTFPIPNPLAGEITDRIKAFETRAN